MTIYKAKKSNLSSLLTKNKMTMDDLEQNTNIPKTHLQDYATKKVMSLHSAMSISKELNCNIEDLYEWKTV